jgi:hypothetical protein
MSGILKESWAKNPERRVKMSKALLKTYDGNIELRRRIGEASRRCWENLDYQEKVTGHGYHHGYFISRCGRIYFASSWELMFLVWCENNLLVSQFGRCEDRIRYEKPRGGSAYYHPDFQLTLNGKELIVEIKGGKSEIDLVERKRLAAIGYYQGGKTYTIMYKADLMRMGIFRSNRVAEVWILDLISQGKVEEHGCGKKCQTVLLQR